MYYITENEAKVVAALLAHCRLGDKYSSENRVALHDLSEKLNKFIVPEVYENVSFTREKEDGSRKTWGPNSKSTISIEIE